MAQKIILSIENLSKSFHKTGLPVLQNISLSVGEGEFVTIIGPSGCGKSTLLDCIAGLAPVDKGDVLLSGKSILNKKGMVSYMFQEDVLFPWRTILQNVIVPLEIVGEKKEKAKKEVIKLLKEFGLEQFANYYPFMLSGGMRERASLLRSYLCKKDVMLLDEPFSKLDAITRQHMQQWFLKIMRQKKKSVLFVTHDVDEAIFLSDRIYVISKRPGGSMGEIVIPIKKPRNETVIVSKEFIDLKKRILHLLKK